MFSWTQGTYLLQDPLAFILSSGVQRQKLHISGHFLDRIIAFSQLYVTKYFILKCRHLFAAQLYSNLFAHSIDNNN